MEHTEQPDLLSILLASALLTLALMAVYGWVLGLIFGIFILVSSALIQAGIIR